MNCHYCGNLIVKNNINQVKYFCCGEHRRAWRDRFTKNGRKGISYARTDTRLDQSKVVQPKQEFTRLT